MAFRLSTGARYALISLTSVLLLLQAGCGLFEGGQTISVKLAPGVKMRLLYIAPLKIYVGRYEVSNRELRCFRPDHTSGNHQNQNLNADNQPVVNVSWKDAKAFCGWLTKNHGATAAGRLRFRLPTEKEWETYATCGKGSDYPWGDWPPPANLNYYGLENSGATQRLGTGDRYCVSCPVRKSGKNKWGLYGVGGNVWEWCEDIDPEDANRSCRIFKGGSWSDCIPMFLSTVCRRSYPPDYKYVNLGFRVVAEPSAVQTTSGQSAPPRH